MQIRVILSDNNPTVREDLSCLLNFQADIDVVGEAKDGQTTLKNVKDLQPDVLVMDLNLIVPDNLELLRRLIAECPKTRVIALSMYADRRYAELCRHLGLSGYLLKECAFEQLIEATRAVASSNRYPDASTNGFKKC